jgi:hypothetical protein
MSKSFFGPTIQVGVEHLSFVNLEPTAEHDVALICHRHGSNEVVAYRHRDTLTWNMMPLFGNDLLQSPQFQISLQSTHDFLNDRVRVEMARAFIFGMMDDKKKEIAIRQRNGDIDDSQVEWHVARLYQRLWVLMQEIHQELGLAKAAA